MLALIRIALSRPYTFIVLALLILIFGVLSWRKTPTDIFPNIDIPVITAVWTYNGLPPEDMSNRIVYYFERALSAQVNDIEHVESQSLGTFGIVKIFFQKNVHIETALPQVNAAADTVLKQIVPGATAPNVLMFNASSVPILNLALSGKGLSESQLLDFGNNFIRPQLATVPGAAVPTPYGGQVRQIQIDIDQRSLQSYGLSAQDVADTLAAQNLITPVGTQKIGKFDYVVDLNDAPRAIADLNNLPIKKVNGTLVFIHDVAFVHDGHPPQMNVVRVNGSHAVLMSIEKAGTASTLDIIKGTKAQLPKIKEGLPGNLEIAPVGDQSIFVTAAVSGVIREGIIAAALTGLMILLFLGSWRSTLIIMISIPLAVLFSVTVLSVIGETINVMTLGGLALAVGILVDDATVTIENINYHLEEGKPVRAAIMDGSRQIVVPATVSLLCICVVFVPMFSLGGVAGFLFRPLAEAVIFAMIGSYILSRTLVPTLANYLLANYKYHPAPDTEAAMQQPDPRPRNKHALVRFQREFERRFEQVRAGYQQILQLAMGRRVPFAIGFLAVVLLSFGLAPFLGQNFFPSIDAGEIKLHVRAQPGTRIEETSALCDRIENAIRGMIPRDDLDRIVDNIGLSASGVNLAYGNSGSIGVQDADVLISLKKDHHSDTAELVDAMRERLPRLFPGTTFSFLPADIVSQILNFGLPAPVDVQVIGRDIVHNRVYAEKILKRIAQVSGVADARIQQVFDAPTLNVELDRSLAAEVGLTERSAANTLQDTLAGSFQTAPTFWLNPATGVSYPLVVQMPQYRINSIGDLNNVPLTAANGSFQLLGGLAKITRVPSAAVVSHYNVQPVIDIYAATHLRDFGGIATDIRRILEETGNEVPRGSVVVLRGQITTMTTAYSELFAGLAFAVVLIYLLIVVNFQSWLDPFVIITGLPAALAGIVWMLFVTNTTLSVPALTGAIMCMGVATANSILVVSFARERLQAGADGITAALESGFTRFRPVLMTALAMMIGMAPMALSADQNAPLGRAVIGGLLFATVATLFFVPVVFSLVHGKQEPHAASDDGTSLQENLSHA
jgi:multidrug efflux pump subunit AcrB